LPLRSNSSSVVFIAPPVPVRLTGSRSRGTVRVLDPGARHPIVLAARERGLPKWSGTLAQIGTSAGCARTDRLPPPAPLERRENHGSGVLSTARRLVLG